MPSSTKPASTRRNPIPAPPPFEGNHALTVHGASADKVLVADPIVERPDGTEPPEPDTLEEPVVTPAQVEEAQFIETERDVVALVPSAAIPATHHLVVGMGTLAALSEEEFKAKLAVMKSGQERIKIIQQELLDSGTDYGMVKGIAKPFLHQPGAEKLSNFYGFAVEQKVDRLEGDGVKAPPLAFIVRSLVHLGDFSGPVIAQGSGEANSWEEKYRYTFAKPICPQCGHDMKRGGQTGKMAGKWFCPGYDGGCWKAIEFTATNPDGTLVIPPPGKVDNDNPYSLAETLVQMAAKRSFVAAIRRATGTSGLFTQDEDSPSVQGESDKAGGDGADPVIESASTVGIQVGIGAKTTQATSVQHDRLKVLVKEKELNGAKIAALLERVFGMEVAPTGAAATAAVRTLDGEQMGRLLQTLETGEVSTESPSMSDGDDSEAAGAGIGTTERAS